jgi:hypothetical protein
LKPHPLRTRLDAGKREEDPPGEENGKEEKKSFQV